MKAIFTFFFILTVSNLFSQRIHGYSSTPHDTTFVNVEKYSSDFVLDMRYATTNNFMNTKVYDCDKCYLRYKTVKALLNANQEFLKLGYKIKLFDCYRPTDVQKIMFDIVPNPTYVADPKNGSIHNRGCAVDLTLVDKKGNELDMGTTFDFFGVEAAHAYQNLSKEVLENRILLKTVLQNNGFNSIKSEWWHYNLKQDTLDNLSNFKWECN
ncbi:M15 family metallopeptidase [Flavobacterium sp. UBA6135]|uniref:M15 family metallopeptidase n=1 Tax=Flavobacterium sp. UBA6135 TaxID=1946553 RepID=UPI0025C4F430|nr:M15 family metallopeptidase [Flavobacterium sp. UBA6135]